MRFVWSEDKRLRTLNERGLDFGQAFMLFDGRPLATFPSPREGETRSLSVAILKGEIVAVIWLDRDGSRRIISMRRAKNVEAGAYVALYGRGAADDEV